MIDYGCYWNCPDTSPPPPPPRENWALYHSDAMTIQISRYFLNSCSKTLDLWHYNPQKRKIPAPQLENTHDRKIVPSILMFVEPCNIVQFIKKNPTRCNNVSKLYYSILVWSSTCFGRYTAHHHEPKTALAASGFSYVEGRWACSWWTLWGLTTSTNYTSKQSSTYEKPEAARADLGSWWWAICRPKHVELHINKK